MKKSIFYLILSLSFFINLFNNYFKINYLKYFSNTFNYKNFEIKIIIIQFFYLTSFIYTKYLTQLILAHYHIILKVEELDPLILS